MANSLTGGKLLDYIERNNISRDALVLSQRVEDIYYDTHNWIPIKKKDFTIININL